MAAASAPIRSGDTAMRLGGPLQPRTLDSISIVFSHHWLLYRRTWRGSVLGNFATPVLFLLAMGVGLGSYVDKGTGGALGGIPYLQFLAPGLLVSSIMQGSVMEATFPVLAGFRWERRFHAMHATPITPASIALGLVAWMTFKATLVATIFTGVIVAFGAARSVDVVLVIPVAMLTALAFATPIGAFMATQRDTNAFISIWRYGITPLFLFSGTFFPIDRLPSVMQPLAWLLPLWHGVDLGRTLALGTVGDNPLLAIAHVVILATIAAIGTVAMTRTFRRQLEGSR